MTDLLYFVYKNQTNKKEKAKLNNTHTHTPKPYIHPRNWTLFAYALGHVNEQYDMHEKLFFFKTEKKSKGHSDVQSVIISANCKLCWLFFIVFDFYGIVCVISSMVAECGTKHRFTKCLILSVMDLFPKCFVKWKGFSVHLSGSEALC